ncbi:putative Fe-S protein [Piscirickettsia salmonis]|uniref:Fe-S protein n=1 Tax=Piscirickettsia salmonis TaxID=1238 RepID=A0A1L6TC12_PISSA|nr:DUF1289 domain-containing protein [Piscirickettsia salmonis]AKP74014.1 hypothetical protein PSLF89_2293 [Piscirickettsia salmonis LF-89 = ATCC VR-1361]ALB22861.1 Fe-S protein [Piscirickettsia salmonis]ALY02836.1 hypothetical protein AWE47_08210 [Piscirickettsia salmonis]AMA42391.1 hypothetical protein AWJ11_08425 [Piscirickettsia salmonis]AOS34861.1 hypothetical protein AVM72_05565 [Piscirickettsia salmonis]
MIDDKATPCVGLCSTVYGDDVCRGCKRFYHEVIDWNQYDVSRKQKTWWRLEQLAVEILQPKIEIVDIEILRAQLDKHQIRYFRFQSPFCWAHALLRAGAEKINDITCYGLKLHRDYIQLSLVEFLHKIEDEFYQKSIDWFNDSIDEIEPIELFVHK